MKRAEFSLISAIFVLTAVFSFQNCTKLAPLQSDFGSAPVAPAETVETDSKLTCNDEISTGEWESELENSVIDTLSIKPNCRASTSFCATDFKYVFDENQPGSLQLDVFASDNRPECLALGSHECSYSIDESGEVLEFNCSEDEASLPLTYYLKGTFTLKQRQALALLKPNPVADCLTNDDYNACLFWKSPVDQQGNAFSPVIDATTDLSALQVQAVHLSGFDTSGELSDGFIRVRGLDAAGNSSSLNPSQGFKFSYANDPDHKLSQSLIYYTWQKMRTYMTELTGAFYADDFQEDSGNKLEAIAQGDEFGSSSFDPTTNTLRFGSIAGHDLALGGDMIAQHIGLANVHYATSGAIANTTTGPESICANGTDTCCNTINGCASAIHMGAADYHAQMLYSDSSSMFEQLTNNTDGLSECGVSRSPAQNTMLTSQQAFDACSSEMAPGHVFLMGRIYASIWWEVRKAAEIQTPGTGAIGVDKLFSAHLPTLTGTDDFLSALDKIVATDDLIYETRFGPMFIDEFARRGLASP